MTLPWPAGIQVETDPAAENPAVAQALAEDVAARFAPRQERPFSILARRPEGTLAGGLNGVSHWGWVYVRHVFVAEDWRGRGLGRRLLQEAEGLARQRGCTGLYLDTFDPRAVAFYQGLGYLPCGVIEDFPPGHRRTFLCKRLEPA